MANEVLEMDPRDEQTQLLKKNIENILSLEMVSTKDEVVEDILDLV